MQRTLVSLATLAAIVASTPVRALDHCEATRKGPEGMIVVSARGVSGTLLWGYTAGTETNPFHNGTTCVTGGPLVAKGCELGPPHSPLATTPPEACTLHLKDGAGTCAAPIRDCTPGLRPRVRLPSRFVDNGDGTVTDTHSGLMWEQKDLGIGPDDPEGVNNLYTWTADGNSPSVFADGTVFTDFLPRVNGVLCSSDTCSGLGGHSDWRLPTLAELRTLANIVTPDCVAPGALPLCDVPIFGLSSAASFLGYWSASTLASDNTQAWLLVFGTNHATTTEQRDKRAQCTVRAVRGGP